MFHEPVLLAEAIRFLVTDRDGIYLDGTTGGGSHSKAILERLGPHGRLLGLDLDRDAVEAAAKQLADFKKRAILRQGNFRDFPQILRELKIQRINGLLLDLGVSSAQIDTAERGFSFDRNGELDMRMNQDQRLNAREILNSYDEAELAQLLKDFGEERRARTVARAIAIERQQQEIRDTAKLRELVTRVVPFQGRAKSLARIFQALRIAVNRELDNLSVALQGSLDHVVAGGRLVVLSYHSLEDRLVKTFMRDASERCVCPPELPVCVCGKRGQLKILTKKPVTPDENEIRRNRRSRSAKLRAAELI